MNLQSLKMSFTVATWLLWCDVRLFLKDWKNNVLNATMWPFAIIIVNAHLLPAMGMPADYGVFSCISMLIIMASFAAWGTGNDLAADLEGPRSIAYDLTLPLPYWLVYIKNILHFGLKSALFSLCALAVGKVLLYSSLDLSHFSVVRFFLVYLIANIFFGAFSLWGAVLAAGVEKFRNIEIRLSGPLFFVCGFTASWATLYNIAPLLAQAMLATPWIYAYEGTRAAIVGQEGYLNYGLCVAMLLFFTVIFTMYGLWLFKKRLDCV